jgi:hypothetical protein
LQVYFDFGVKLRTDLVSVIGSRFQFKEAWNVRNLIVYNIALSKMPQVSGHTVVASDIKLQAKGIPYDLKSELADLDVDATN